MKKLTAFFVSALLFCGCLGFAACGSPQETLYTVTMSNEAGAVLSSKTARAGELVTVKIVKDGYTLGALYVDGKRVEGDSFVMPARDVAVTAALENGAAGAHTVSVSETGECGRTVADLLSAQAGETVTLTTYVAYGCSLAGYLVNGEKIDGNSFEMPDADAVVTVLYDSLPETDVMFTVSQSYQNATSRWYAGYGDDGFTVEAVVDDNILFTDTKYIESFAYADNIEFIVGQKTAETGWNGRYKIIVDAAGHSEIRRYAGGWTAVNVGMRVTVQRCTLEENGFNGYRANVFLPYSALGLNRSTAPGNISIAPAMRNTLNGLKTAWASYSGMHCNWNDSKTHLIVSADGSFVPGDFSVQALFAGDGLFSLERWGNFYSDVGGIGDVYSIGETGRDMRYWCDNLETIASHAPETVYFGADPGDKSPLAAFSGFLDFMERFRAALPNVKLVVVSPVPSLADSDPAAAQAYAAMLEDYLSEQDGVGFVDLCGSVCKGAPNRNLYASATALSEDGYALLGKLIREEAGRYTGVGGAAWGDCGPYVASGNWTEKGLSLTLASDGTCKIYYRTPFAGDFDLSLQLKARQVYNGDAYPKFGFTIQNGERAYAFYISGENNLTAERAGYVPYMMGVFDWDNSSETAVPGLKYTAQYATLRLVRTGGAVTFTVNGTAVFSGSIGGGNGQTVVGLFSFNTAIDIANWQCKAEDGAV